MTKHSTAIHIPFQPSCFHLSHQICITYVKGFVLYSLEERDNRKRGPRNQFGPKIFLGGPKRLAILCLKHCKRTKWNININIHIYICHIFFIHSSVDENPLRLFPYVGYFNSAAMKKRVHASFQMSISILFG